MQALTPEVCARSREFAVGRPVFLSPGVFPTNLIVRGGARNTNTNGPDRPASARVCTLG